MPVPDALLRQTLYNLVQNAVDVSPHEGTVTVSAITEGNECVLRVTDDGPGVPAAIRDRMFDPFFSPKDHTMKTGGTEFEVRLPMIPLDTGALR